MANIAKLPSVQDPAGYVALEIRSQMARRGWSQRRVALMLNTTQAAVSRRLTGDVAFDASELAQLAKAFGMHPGEFFPAESEGPQPVIAGVRLTADEERIILALRSTAPAVNDEKALGLREESEGSVLPDVDSNHEPAG